MLSARQEPKKQGLIVLLLMAAKEAKANPVEAKEHKEEKESKGESKGQSEGG
jgi:hypothetical protein